MRLIGGLHLIDIIIFIVLLRIIYTSVRSGVLNESIKLLGALIASFFSLQYYPFLGDILEKIPFLPYRKYVDVFSFIIIFVIVISLFMFLRRFLSAFYKKGEEIPSWERGLSLSLAAIRSFSLAGAFVFMLYIFPPANQAVNRSFSSAIFGKTASLTYRGGFKLYKLINPGAVFNRSVMTH